MSKRKYEILLNSILKFGLFKGITIVNRLQGMMNISKDKSKSSFTLKKNDAIISMRNGSSDPNVFIEVFIDEVYEFNTSDINVKTIIDAGANIGLTSIFFALKYPEAKIFAMEPENGNFDLLCQNVKAFKNVIPIHAALTPVSGKVELVDPNYGDWGFRLKSVEKDAKVLETVNGFSLEDIMEEYNINQVDIFKMDIEGSEIGVFEQSAHVIQKIPYTILELHPEVNGSIESFISFCAKNTPHFIKGRGENLIIKYIQ